EAPATAHAHPTGRDHGPAHPAARQQRDGGLPQLRQADSRGTRPPRGRREAPCARLQALRRAAGGGQVSDEQATPRSRTPRAKAPAGKPAPKPRAAKREAPATDTPMATSEAAPQRSKRGGNGGFQKPAYA